MRMKILETTGVDGFGELSQWGLNLARYFSALSSKLKQSGSGSITEKGLTYFGPSAMTICTVGKVLAQPQKTT